MLILVQQTLIYRISNHLLGRAMIIHCTYQMTIGKIRTFFLYFVTKTRKIQFVLSFLSSIALGGTGTVFQDYFPIYYVLVFFRTFFSNFGFLGLASRLGPSGALEMSPTACLGSSYNRMPCTSTHKYVFPVIFRLFLSTPPPPKNDRK